MVEHYTRNVGVAGSNPVVLTKMVGSYRGYYAGFVTQSPGFDSLSYHQLKNITVGSYNGYYTGFVTQL